MHQHLVSKNLIIISLVSSFVCFSILICVLLNYISHHSETSGLLVKGVLVVWLMDMSLGGAISAFLSASYHFSCHLKLQIAKRF